MTFTVRGVVDIATEQAASKITALGNRAKSATSKLGGFFGRFKSFGRDTSGLGEKTKLASGSVANLTAQYNDLVVMMAAGQNPMQMAIQQGTQITQVFGNAGAAQALRMLKSAAVQMISPLNLITIGAIAAGGALVQWALSAIKSSDEIDKLTKRTEALVEARKGLISDVRQASLGVSAEELSLLDAILKKERELTALRARAEAAQGPQRRRNAPAAAALSEAQAALDALREQLAELRALQDAKKTLEEQTKILSDQERVLGAQMQSTARQTAEAENIAQLLRDGINAATIEGMALAGVDLSEPIKAAQLEAAALASTLQITFAEAEKLRAARATPYVSSGRGADPRRFDPGNQKSAQFVPSADTSARAKTLQAERAAVERLIETMQRRVQLLQTTDPIQKELIANQSVLTAATEAQRLEIERLIRQRQTANDTAGAEAQLTALRQEVAIRELIVQHGAESKEVATARLSEERKVFVATTKSKTISEDLKNELIAAWDASKGIASVDMAGNIERAVGQATRLSQGIATAFALAERRSGYAKQSNNNGLDTLDPRNPNNTRAGTYLREYGTDSPFRSSGGTGGGGTNQLNAYLSSLRQQLDLLRTTDPVQKEMIKNRNVLKTATEAETKAVKDLITTRISEENAIARATENTQLFGDAMLTSLDALILRGAKGKDVLADLLITVSQLLLKSAALGQGPLANIFGMGNSGGLAGLIGGFLFPGAQALAMGGPIFGAGGPRDDKVPVLASPGEYIVNAKATSLNKRLLDYINAGGNLAAFEGGGGIAAPKAAPNAFANSAPAPAGRVVLELAPAPEFDMRVLRAAQGVSIETLSQYRDNGLVQDLQRYSDDPGRIG